tara:strand:+ start:1267 stop:1464 length:198 start_codon:yes stop_codon:yes gene_type:complete
MNKLSYNNWMSYIYNTLHKETKVEVKTKFGIIGKRSEIQIQDEIIYLKKLDTFTSNKVRSTYSLK